MKESDLYPHIKKFLTESGYEVKGEIRSCDVAAIKGDELIAIELKQSINLTLVLQAVERQEACDSVYIAVPAEGSSPLPDMKRKLRLIKRLCLGLLVVRFLKHRVRVDLVCHPADHKVRPRHTRRRAILREFHARSSDTTAGGSQGMIMTAYREEALFIAGLLRDHGILSPSACKKLGASDKAGSILYANHYGWFERSGHGKYELHAAGYAAVSSLSMHSKGRT